LISALLYIVMGSLFMGLALYYAEETIWNVRTILFTSIATFDFGVAIRMFRMYFRLRNDKK